MSVNCIKCGVNRRDGHDLLCGVCRNRQHVSDPLRICAVVGKCGPNGEPLACGHGHGHEGPHSWEAVQSLVAAVNVAFDDAQEDAMTADDEGPGFFIDAAAGNKVADLLNAMDEEPHVGEEPWKCQNPKCGRRYAEYVNGCPACSEGAPGRNWSVHYEPAAEKVKPVEVDPPTSDYAVGSLQWAHDLTDRVVRRVAELPDRDSPGDWPEAMLVTAAELREIVAEEAGRPSSST